MHNEVRGLVGESFPVPVELGKVCEFASAAHSPDDDTGEQPVINPAPRDVRFKVVSRGVVWPGDTLTCWALSVPPTGRSVG